MKEDELIPRLFRQEFSKLVAVISKSFGLQYIGIAEDIVSETFLTATENWNKKGIPENPTAWLYVVAKQKALYHFRRKKIFDKKVLPQHQTDADLQDEPVSIVFSDQNIMDSQLEMMFAVCNPAIASEAQIALALRILCGFSIEEIAEAFLTNKETINKRLSRAKERLRAEKIKLENPSPIQIGKRLDNVLHIIYLLFNEGYYSSVKNKLLQKDLCHEAIHLCRMLTEYQPTDLPKTNALMALMCFHSSRFDARQNENNEMILYDEQDETLWNKELIEKGEYFLDRSAQGGEISSYHLEAGIAYWHCRKEDSTEKWENILQHYNLLLQINYSPSVALNRSFALYKARGKAAALKETEKLQLSNNRFYHVLLGELYTDIDNAKAKEYLTVAFSMTNTDSERQIISTKMKRIN